VGRPVVHVLGSHPPAPFIEAYGYFHDGSTGPIQLKSLIPHHDAALGTYYLGLDGQRWKALDGIRLVTVGDAEVPIGGPGWFTPLEDEAPED
jgi:hypothetical protein